MSDDQFIPFSRPSISEEDVEAVAETIRSGWWTTGPRVREFEAEFAEYVGAGHAVAANSCTAGLHVALRARGVGPGDLVVVPTNTFAASGEVVLYLGATPVLMDTEDESMCVDPSMLSSFVDMLEADDPAAALDEGENSGAISGGVRRVMRGREDARLAAVIPVHFAGQSCDMTTIAGAAERCGASIIGDAAHAIETTYGSTSVGALGDAAAFSFYATKNLSTGEGGMVTTDDGELADHMRRLTLHGISQDAWKRYTKQGSWFYEIQEVGYKYNMTDLAATLGLNQLGRIDAMSERRRAIVGEYQKRLADVPGLRLPTDQGRGRHAWHLYIVRLALGELSIDRADFIDRLNEAGVGTSVHFIPLHMHPLYRDEYGYREGDYPVAERTFERFVSLPLYPSPSDADVERVCDAVTRICVEHQR